MEIGVLEGTKTPKPDAGSRSFGRFQFTAFHGLDAFRNQNFSGERRTMLEDSTDRRSMRRFDMRLPVAIRFNDASRGAFFTETQNVSARGVFFYLDREVAPGSRIEVTLTFPPHITLTDAVRVRFAARVIRVETPSPSARIGIAAMIEEYEFLRSGPNPDFAAAFPPQWKV
jgi:hypothetical protein